MIDHEVRVAPADRPLPREEQLAWRLAGLATDAPAPSAAVVDMVINRVIDDTAVAVAALGRDPVTAAADQALAHPARPGAPVLGAGRGRRVCPAWAAWANGVAVRELDFGDTYLAADYAHPGDAVPALLAVAAHCRRTGADLLGAVIAAYEVQVALTDGICLHEHGIDHVAHLGPAVATGLGALLGLDTATTYQAVQQTLHCTTATRQSRRGEISSWKAYAPAFAAKVAVEATDRAMRGQNAPSPTYEGVDGVIARLLGGAEAGYRVRLPGAGEPREAILRTYPKEYSAEYQAQAFIDLAFRLRERVAEPTRIREIVLHTSHHTHTVIGSGAGDPQKYDPAASRETLDHSVAYIVAVALQDGRWDHVDSYAPERAGRADTVALWRRIRTVEDAEWTRRYHAAEPDRRAFGGRAVVHLDDGTELVEQLAVADAHPQGSRPFGRAQYVAKLHRLSRGALEAAERDRFLDVVTGLPDLPAGGCDRLTVTATTAVGAGTEGIF